MVWFRVRSIALRLLPVALVVAACSPATPAAPAAPNAPARDNQQNLRVAIRQMAANPTPSASNGDHHIYWAMFDKLTEFEGDFVIKPSIATKWEASPDAMKWRFTLRNDVTWPDGSALTADDVVFTYEQIRDRRWPQISYLGSVTGVTAIDPTTVEFSLRAADGTIPSAATYFWVFPKKYFEQVGFDGFVQKPVGSGPYEMTEFKANDVIRFKKRSTPHAFRKAEVDELSFRQIPEVSAVTAGLQTGEIDLAIDPAIGPDAAERMKAAGITVSSRTTAITSLNIPQGSYEARNTPFANPKVRQAIAYHYCVSKSA